MANSNEVELKVRIPKDLFSQVEEYRFSGRYASRKAAVVDLLAIALSSTQGDNSAASADTGIVSDDD